MVLLETPHANDLNLLKTLLENHGKYTNSKIAEHILSHWAEEQLLFTKVMPKEYKLALQKQEKSFIKIKVS